MARPPGRLWWRLSSDLLVGDTRSWPETSPGTIEVSLCFTHTEYNGIIITVPLAGSSLVTPIQHVARVTPVCSPVTQSSSLSVEDTTLVCVALSEPTSSITLMHLRPIMMEM